MGPCSNLHQNPLCDFDFIRVLQLTWCHMFIQVVVQGSSKGTLSSSNFSKYCVYVFLTRPTQYTTYAASLALRAVTTQCIRLVTRHMWYYEMRVFIKGMHWYLQNIFLIWQEHGFIIFIIMFHKSLSHL